jgi:hypothetical protein
VVVHVNYQAVSHAIGIVGVIYQIASTGGAQVATVAGLLSTGTKKAKWWIPSDSMSLSIGPTKLPTLLLS